MKKVLPYLLLTFLIIVPLASSVFAQVTCTTDEQSYGSCVSGECFCWSMTITCSGYTCVVSGGQCDYGIVVITGIDSSECASGPIY